MDHVGREVVTAADRCCGAALESISEYGKSPEDATLMIVEEGVAPVEGRAHRALAGLACSLIADG